MTREDVTFSSGGVRCAGWFYRVERTGPGPCVVMAHGLAGVKEMRLDAYAERFAAAGYHVLVFDYRHFGASGGEPRQLLDIGRQHEDWLAAVSYARTREEVDPGRIALWGSSLSGGHVMAVAREAGASVVVAQVPHVSGPVSLLKVPPREIARLTADAIRDLAHVATGRAPVYVPAAGRPGQHALMTAPEAMEYLDLVPPGYPFDDRVAARFALRIGLYSPGRALKDLDVPVLVQVGDRDQTTPPGPAVKAAARARQGRLTRHACGHFEPYTGEMFETFVTEQLAFLEEHLPAR